jgi:hypothetical protein
MASTCSYETVLIQQRQHLRSFEDDNIANTSHLHRTNQGSQSFLQPPHPKEIHFLATMSSNLPGHQAQANEIRKTASAAMTEI